MPTPRIHADNAARQRAFRERAAAARIAERQAKGLPATAPIPTMPSQARWIAATTMAYDTLNTTLAEMQAYFDDRNETWQESDRGEEFQRRIDSIQDAINALE